jgi:uncharacterized protein
MVAQRAPGAQTGSAGRIQSLDILRGFALLGMIIVHFHDKSTEPGGIDDAVRFAIWRLVESKSHGTFALLFGAGFAILLRRAEARGHSITSFYLRRLGVLALFGFVAHGFFGFNVLLGYAVWGVPLLFIRKWSTRALIVTAVFSAASLALYYLVYNGIIAMNAGPAGVEAATRARFAWADNVIAAVAAAEAQGNYLVLLQARLVHLAWFSAQPFFFLPGATLTLFIAGFLLVRHGVFENPLGHRKLLIGMATLGFVSWVAADWVLPYFGIRGLLGLIRDQWLMFTYVSVALLILAFRPALVPQLRLFANAGRMALSNYLVQIIAVDLLFSGYAIGLGEVRPVVGLPMALSLFAGQAVYSTLWLQHFRFGPAEWLWRSLTYGEAQPMRRAVQVGVFATLLMTAAAGGAQVQVPPQSHVAIAGITVIDVQNGSALADQTVVINVGRITAVGPARTIQAPAGVQIIDGRGKFLIPGLIDTHVHLGNSPQRDQLQPIGPLLAHGVTGVRDAGAGGQDDWLVTLRGRAAKGEVLSPRVYVSGMVSGRSVTRAKAADAATLARDLVAKGVDGLKIRDGLTPDDIRAVIAVGRSANIPVYGHTSDAATRERDEIYTLHAIKSGAAGAMHIMGMPQVGATQRPSPPAPPRFGANWAPWWIYYATLWRHADPAAEVDLIRTMVRQDAWLEPTLITEDFVVNAAAYRDSWTARKLGGSFELVQAGFPKPAGAALEDYREAVGRMKNFVHRFHAAGGTITTGTDCLPWCGYGLPDELRLLVEAGLTPAAALRAATIDGARVLRWPETGRIAPNFTADVVVLDANPLQDIANVRRVHAVVVNGRYLDRGALDALLK